MTSESLPNPPHTDHLALQETQRLLSIMRRLRALDGCPWDRLQSFESIAPYTVEEAYEVADAIGRGDKAGLRDELGDLLFQVIYHAQIAAEEGSFGFADVARSISDKMIVRHPHVFGHEAARDARAQTTAWESGKALERAARGEVGTLAAVPATLPALTRATKLTRRAEQVGFDWPDIASVFEKLDEEVAELRAELPSSNPERLKDELGDLLFVLANLARKLDLDPEVCLRGANSKFERRFGSIERALSMQGRTPNDASLEEMEILWNQAKKDETSGSL